MKLSIKDEMWWGAELRLPSWVGYQSRLGDYGSKDKRESSDGTIALIFAPEGRGVEPLSEQEMGLVRWFEHNEPTVSEQVKLALLQWCSLHSPERTNEFDFDDDFPTIANEDDLKRNVGLYAVNIHQVNSDGVPYVGYEFGCEWDEEHGAGVLMHGTNVVRIGSADTAILLWIAQQDTEQRT